MIILTHLPETLRLVILNRQESLSMVLVYLHFKYRICQNVYRSSFCMLNDIWIIWVLL